MSVVHCIFQQSTKPQFLNFTPTTLCWVAQKIHGGGGEGEGISNGEEGDEE
jgi:hypothetical protein